MRYLFQRVIHNDNGWTGPTSGRLKSTGDGAYLEEMGFGHEDWNFSKDTCADGNSYGYMYYQPKLQDGPFSILFATYDKSDGWALCGYYVGAKFVKGGAVFPRHVLRRRASELKALDAVGSLGKSYRRQSIDQIANFLKQEAQYYRWCVKPSGIRRLQQPILLPRSLTSRFAAYFTRPTELEKMEWERVIAFSARFVDKARQDDYSGGGETEFPEGKKYEALHKVRERNKKLVAKAKAEFKSRFGRLLCEACGFDFAATYGNAGLDFIEIHHKIPVSDLTQETKVKISDLAPVCSNCHRILHRRRPWLSIDALRRLIKRAAKA